MKGIHIFSTTFPDSLARNFNISKLAIYLEVALGKTRYHLQDGDIPNTGIRLILLPHISFVDEIDPSIFYKLPG
jgi:hypothetical protein